MMSKAILTKAGARRIGYLDLVRALVDFEGITQSGTAAKVFYQGELIARNLALKGKARGLIPVNPLVWLRLYFGGVNA